MFKIRFQQLLILILFAGASAGLLFPLLTTSTFIYGPDAGMHIFSAEQFSQEIQAGNWYPRWLGEWYGGYGAPYGVAYSPALYFGVAGLSFLGIGTLLGLKILLWATGTLTGLAMYALSRHFMSRLAALAAGILYLAMPYRTIDLFARAALPEYVVFLWLPMILLFVVLCIKEGNFWQYLMLAFSVAGLILTHVMIAYLFFPLLALMILYFIADSRKWFYTLLKLGIAGAFGVLLTTIYILPLFMESQYMNVDWLTPDGPNPWGDYRNNFLFSASTYIGTEFENVYRENILMGVAAVMSGVGGALGFVLVRITWRERTLLSQRVTIGLFLVMLISGAMTIKFSDIIWEYIPRGDHIVFPARWLTITSFAAAFLMGKGIARVHSLWRHRDRRSYRKGYLQLIGGLVILSSLAVIGYSGYLMWRARDAIIIPETIEQLLGSEPISDENIHWVFDAPYLTIWGRAYEYWENPIVARVTSDKPIELNIRAWENEYREFDVTAEEETTINIRTYWFPGWAVLVDGEVIDIDTQEEDGTMLALIPAGESTVEARFFDTRVRQISRWVTYGAGGLFAGLLALTILTAPIRFYRNRKTGEASDEE